MSTTTPIESAAAPWSGGDTVFIYLVQIIMIVGGAALYASVLTMAANWANHKKKFVVRKLILIWAWSHPFLMALPFAFFPSRNMLLSGRPEYQQMMNVFLACWASAIIAWILILTTRVDRPRISRAGR